MINLHKNNPNIKTRYETLIDGLDLNNEQKSILRLTWLDYLLLLDKAARRGWISFNYSQLIVIIVSLSIPILEGSNLKNYNWFGLTIISLLSFIVAALSALNRQLGFEGKWRHYRKNAEMIRNEGDDFLALSGHYIKKKNQQDAFNSFITTITTFKRQEANLYLQIHQGKNDNANDKT